jgi:hypothetical protein
MPNLNKSRILTAVLLASASLCRAQTAVVTVETNLTSANVFADSVWVGSATQRTFTVPVASRTLRLVPSQADAWTITPQSRPLRVEAGDSVQITMNFPYYYRIATIPYAVPVYHESASGRVYLGETPLTHQAEAPLEGELILDAPGYHIVHLEPGSKVWNAHNIPLRPVERAGDSPSSEVAWNPPGRRHRWIDYAALGTAAIGGALAIHYKFKADRRFDEYEQTGDPALRPEIERLDLYSGIALGGMQVGLGVFAVRLVLR